MQYSLAGLKKSFFVDLYTVVQSWMGFSLVFPIFAPLLFSVDDAVYFSFNDSMIFKTSVLGCLYGLYGIGQGFGVLIWSFCSRLLGKMGGQILWCLFMLMGYLVMSLGVYQQHLAALFAGRLLTGIGSAATWISQSAVLDLSEPPSKRERGKIFFTAGALAFMIGPWIGGTLSRLPWIRGTGGLIFGALFCLVHLLFIFLFYQDTSKAIPPLKEKKGDQLFFRIIAEFKSKRGNRLWTIALYFLGFMSFFLFISPFLTLNFNAIPEVLGDLYAYFLLLFVLCMTLFSPLFSLLKSDNITLLALLVSALGIFLFSQTTLFWTLWISSPVVIFSSYAVAKELMETTQKEGGEQSDSAHYAFYPIVALGSLTLSAFVLAPLLALQTPLPLGIASCFYLLAFLICFVSYQRG